jgi:hypothetical protein
VDPKENRRARRQLLRLLVLLITSLTLMIVGISMWPKAR